MSNCRIEYSNFAGKPTFFDSIRREIFCESLLPTCAANLAHCHGDVLRAIDRRKTVGANTHIGERRFICQITELRQAICIASWVEHRDDFRWHILVERGAQQFPCARIIRFTNNVDRDRLGEQVTDRARTRMP